MKRYLFCCFIVFIGFNRSTYAQNDSINYSVSTYGSVASRFYQPYWLVANQFGMFPDNRGDITLALSANYHLQMRHFNVEAKVNLVGNLLANRFLVQELHAKIKFKSFQVIGGRENYVVGEVDSLLSSGSLAISGNSLPIPKVGFRSNEFIFFPLGKKPWLGVKFSWFHGWMGSDRFVKNSFLHEKSLYFKLGNQRFSFYGGMAHFAIWGGEGKTQRFPSKFDDFLKVTVGGSLGKKQDDLGDHMGVWDFGITSFFADHTFHMYTQSIYERGYVRNPQTPAQNKGTRILGQDRLLGLSVKTTEDQWMQRVVVEFITTRSQGGNSASDGLFNYYNDATYSTGWIYKSRIIGTPTFISQQHSNYVSNIANPGDRAIVSNRVKGVHLGMTGQISTKLKYMILVTYVNHFGNYHNDQSFDPSKKQVFTCIEGIYRLSNQLKVETRLAIDRGALADNEGIRVGLQWQ